MAKEREVGYHLPCCYRIESECWPLPFQVAFVSFDRLLQQLAGDDLAVEDRVNPSLNLVLYLR